MNGKVVKYIVNIELTYSADHIAHLFYRIIFTIYSEYGGECVKIGWI